MLLLLVKHNVKSHVNLVKIEKYIFNYNEHLILYFNENVYSFNINVIKFIIIK